MITVREIPSKVARSMTFKIYFPEVAQFPNEANLLMVDDDKFNPTSPLFPLGKNEISASRGGKVSEKPDAETGLSREREAGIFRPSFGRNGHAWAGQTHISPLFERAPRFSRGWLEREIYFLHRNHPAILFTLIL